LKNLIKKIHDRSGVVGVVGLGYVGLPLAVLQAKNNFRVIGIDESIEKIDKINQGINYILDVNNEDLQSVVESGYLIATSDFRRLQECDVILVCVPTPLTPNKEPDITAIEKVTAHIARHAHNDMLVVLESTTYPGTTEEVIIPSLVTRKLRVGENLFVAFSPERVDPGNRSFKTQNTYKLVGGTSANCLEVART